MKHKSSLLLTVFWAVILVGSLGVASCGKQTPTPSPAAATSAPVAEATTEPTSTPTEARVVNRAGVELPADAAPIEQQVLRIAVYEKTWLSCDYSFYDYMNGPEWGLHDTLVMPDLNFNPIPNAAERWEVSEDGLTWTFYLRKEKVWSDGVPLTADDWVFTFQRAARADFDFEWFFGMGGIVNWGKVVSGELPPEELGVKKVDDYTLTVTTEQPTPFLAKLLANLRVVPKHIVKDRMADGTWALDPATAVSAGPYKLDHYTKGKEILWVANEKYTGPLMPMWDQILTPLNVDSAVAFTMYQEGQLDMLSPGPYYDRVKADPELSKQMLVWPHFKTYYLFFDTWNPPFDNLKVRQAFSHAIDRDRLVEGPVGGLGVPAYTMNPPGFPGESVEELKDIQAYDPQLAADLLAEAGYPGGQGFPKLTLWVRDPESPPVAEACAAMLKENLGIEVEIQQREDAVYMGMLYDQKANKGGDMLFALVNYEYDFVDGSNLLSVWGNCETEGADLSAMPGRHAWYNQKFNELVCEANHIMDDEAQRNELYQQAEKILIEDVALVPLYHPTLALLINPKIKGPALTPHEDGSMTFRGHAFGQSETQLYRTK